MVPPIYDHGYGTSRDDDARYDEVEDDDDRRRPGGQVSFPGKMGGGGDPHQFMSPLPPLRGLAQISTSASPSPLRVSILSAFWDCYYIYLLHKFSSLSMIYFEDWKEMHRSLDSRYTSAFIPI